MSPKDDAATVAHVLNRITYGPSRDDLRWAGKIGVEAFIREQLQPERLPDQQIDTLLASLPTLQQDVGTLFREYPPPQLARRMMREDEEPDPEMIRRMAVQSMTPLRELATARMVRAVRSRRQLVEVLTDFWFNHFNVFANKGQVRYLVLPYERDTIRPRVLGRFRELLGAVARSPAMLVYLDNWRSAAEEDHEVAGSAPGRRRFDAVEDAIRRLSRFRRGSAGMAAGVFGGQWRDRPQGARQQRRQSRPDGLNENYARELMELHTLGVDGGYSQHDVREVARALTGWTLTLSAQGANFVFRPDWHDADEKEVLGHRLPAGRGIEDGEEVLDLLASHPSTARFIATKLARRFVADDPPTRLIEKIAKRFSDSDGNLRETMAALLTSPEFLGPSYRQSKVKNPLEFLASAARALALEIRPEAQLARALQPLGAPLYNAAPPTGYPDSAEEWTSANALLARMEIAGRLAQGVFGRDFGRDRTAGRSRRRPARGQGRDRGPAGNPEQRTEALLAQLLPGRDTGALQRKLLDWVDEQAEEPGNAQLATLILGSPEFQRR
ncbi:MAG: DUF1800 domain-containing protein [Acidobacteriota bacterium]